MVISNTDDRSNGKDRPPGRRWLWFALLWMAGVVAVAALAYGIRALMALL